MSRNLWIGLIVGAAALQSLTTYLGYKVTVTAPRTLRQQRIYEAIFIIAGVLGVICVGLAAYLGTQERAHIAHNLWPTYTPTGVSPEQVKWPDFLEINQPLAFNLGFTNVGKGTAFNFRQDCFMFMEPDISKSSESDAIARFHARSSVMEDRGGGTLTPTESTFVTCYGAKLSPEDRDNISLWASSGLPSWACTIRR